MAELATEIRKSSAARRGNERSSATSPKSCRRGRNKADLKRPEQFGVSTAEDQEQRRSDERQDPPEGTTEQNEEASRRDHVNDEKNCQIGQI